MCYFFKPTKTLRNANWSYTEWEKEGVDGKERLQISKKKSSPTHYFLVLLFYKSATGNMSFLSPWKRRAFLLKNTVILYLHVFPYFLKNRHICRGRYLIWIKNLYNFSLYYLMISWNGKASTLLFSEAQLIERDFSFRWWKAEKIRLKMGIYFLLNLMFREHEI